MQFFGILSLVITVAIIAWWFSSSNSVVVPANPEPTLTDTSLDPVIAAHIAEKSDLIRVTMPKPNDHIGSPLTITGEARGTWFFEASFPIILTNWDGLIIAEGHATAQSEWMTEDFVPFVATLSFTNPYQPGDPDFMQRGSLILKRDNPTGLPEHDDALEFPIRYSATNRVVPAQGSTATYSEMLDAAQGAASSMER